MSFATIFRPRLALAAGGILMASFSYSNYKPAACKGKIGYLKSGATLRPHPEKEYKGGEDSFVVKEKMISVADGVGGWAKRGVDVALYSKELMGLITQAYDQSPHSSPKEILTEAHKKSKEIGSSTVVIAILDPDEEKLATTLLGDSSYMILRPLPCSQEKTKVRKQFRSIEQQHRFNWPFQVGTNKDHPYRGADEVHNVQHNDVIVMGTDGIWDNVFDNEIINIIQDSLESNGNLNDPQKASREIAAIAFEHSHDKKFRSPFQIHSEESAKKTYYGGKKDDITVIVSQVMLE